MINILTLNDKKYLEELKTSNPEIYEFIMHIMDDTKQDIKVACHDICNIISLIFGNYQLLELTNSQLSDNPRWLQMNDDLRYLISSMEAISFFRYADKVSLTPTNLDAYLNDTLTYLKAKPEFAGLNFTICNDAVNTTINLDQNKTKFIFEAILNNVVDRTPESNIVIHIEKDDSNLYMNISDDSTFVPFDIRDTMFNPFVTDKQRHLGLSLASCFQIMMAQNGTIEYIPNLDTGSTFALTFNL